MSPRESMMQRGQQSADALIALLITRDAINPDQQGLGDPYWILRESGYMLTLCVDMQDPTLGLRELGIQTPDHTHRFPIDRMTQAQAGQLTELTPQVLEAFGRTAIVGPDQS